MADLESTAVIRTVRGDVPVGDMGITLGHEHLFIDLSWQPDRALPATQRKPYYAPLHMKSLYTTGRNHANLDDRLLLDLDVAIDEVTEFTELGGKTIIDATSIGLGRDPHALVAVAQATGLNIVMGSGYYVSEFHPAFVAHTSEDDLAAGIVRDIVDGVDDTGVRAGVIGEIGMSYPRRDSETRVLRAAGIAQAETGAALIVHPGRDESSPYDHLAVLSNTACDTERIVMAHIERTQFTTEQHVELAERGCYLSFDLFGRESSFHSMAAIDMPNDATRVDYIVNLAERGLLDRVLISHDICYKTALSSYGGPGYSHILAHIVPLMLRKGLTHEQIDTILIANPARAFGIA